MLFIILICILTSLIFAGCQYRNYVLREREATVEPLFTPYKVPLWHNVCWVGCWILLLGGIVLTLYYFINH